MDASIQPMSSRASARWLSVASTPTATSAVSIRSAPRVSPRTIQAHPKPMAIRSAMVGSLTRHQLGSVDVRALSSGEHEVRVLTSPSNPGGGGIGCVRVPLGVSPLGDLGDPVGSSLLEGECFDAFEEPVPAMVVVAVDVDDDE